MKSPLLYQLILLLLFSSFSATGQAQLLKGIILNKNTATAISDVLLRTSSDSTSSHSDGQFLIKTRPEDTVLQIIHPLYKSLHLHIPSRQEFLTLFLQPDQGSAPDTVSNSYQSRNLTSSFFSNAIKAYKEETYKKKEEHRFIETLKIPYSAFTLNSSQASYNNLRRFMNQNKKVPPSSVRIGELLNHFSFHDSLPAIYPGRPLDAYADLATCPWHPGHWLMRVAVQSEKKPDSLSRPENMVLLIDISGSMSQPDRLPLLKIAFNQLVEQLTRKDTLAIVAYTEKARLVLSPTPGTEKQKIREVINHLQAGGTTAGSRGIEKAFKIAKEHYIPNGNNRVILATDGDFNVGKTSDREMESMITRYRKWGISITCIGVGSGNYKDSKLETLAHWGQGTFAYLDNKEAAFRLFGKNYDQKKFITARDAILKTIFNPNRIKAFRLIGYDSGGNKTLSYFTDHFLIPGKEVHASERMTAYYELIPRNDQALQDSLLCTFILQYKGLKDQNKYIQIYPVRKKVSAFKNKNADWRFGASVALFGMLLQQSKYVGQGNFALSKKIARRAKESIIPAVYEDYLKMLRQAKKQHKR